MSYPAPRPRPGAEEWARTARLTDSTRNILIWSRSLALAWLRALKDCGSGPAGIARRRAV
jgi:hypothetical protein